MQALRRMRFAQAASTLNLVDAGTSTPRRAQECFRRLRSPFSGQDGGAYPFPLLRTPAERNHFCHRGDTVFFLRSQNARTESRNVSVIRCDHRQCFVILAEKIGGYASNFSQLLETSLVRNRCGDAVCARVPFAMAQAGDRIAQTLGRTRQRAARRNTAAGTASP